jgi:hypothetical protein
MTIDNLIIGAIVATFAVFGVSLFSVSLYTGRTGPKR